MGVWCVCVQSPLLSVFHSRFYTSYPISYLFSCLGLGLSISLSISNNTDCFTSFICGFVVWVSLISAHLCHGLFSLSGLWFPPVNVGESGMTDFRPCLFSSGSSEARISTLSMAGASPTRLHLASIFSHPVFHCSWSL